MVMGVTALQFIAVPFQEKSLGQFKAAQVLSEGFKARLLAHAGFQAGLAAIRNVPEEYLYSSGLVLNPPNISISEKCKGCFISYRIQPEDGKININNLVLTFEDRPNETYRAMLRRLFQPLALDIPVENVFAYCLSALGLGGARLKRYAAVFHCRSDQIRCPYEK